MRAFLSHVGNEAMAACESTSDSEETQRKLFGWAWRGQSPQARSLSYESCQNLTFVRGYVLKERSSVWIGPVDFGPCL